MPNSPVPERIEWEDPAPRETRQGSKWDPIAAALKKRPGRWACIGRGISTTVVSQIRKGSLKCFQPKGSFEAVTRNNTDQWNGDVYARYVGEPE